MTEDISNDVPLSLQPSPPAPSYPDGDTSRPETEDRVESPWFPVFDREPFRPEFYPDPINNIVPNGAIGPSIPTQRTSPETEKPTSSTPPESPLDVSGPGEITHNQCLVMFEAQLPSNLSLLLPSPFTEDRCSLVLDPGPCRNYVVRWYYDGTANSCAQFWFGGCLGNSNQFLTEEICKEKCVKV